MEKDVTFLRRLWTKLQKKENCLARREKLAMQLFSSKTCQSEDDKNFLQANSFFWFGTDWRWWW